MSDFFAASEDVVSREVSGEMVLLDLASGMYFGLNSVGVRVWQLLSEQPHSVDQLVDAIEAEFDAPRDLIATDLAALTSEMLERQLILPEGG